MLEEKPLVHISDIDEKRFGYKTAKAYLISHDNLQQVLTYCRNNAVEFLIVRCNPGEIKTVHAMVQSGFKLMDTLVDYSFYFLEQEIPDYTLETVDVRKILPGEEKLVEHIARKAFVNHVGHYHMDDKLDKRKCAEVYASWAYNCCISKDYADQVFVASVDGWIKGFSCVKRISGVDWKGVLMGVLPEFQKQGLSKPLIAERIKYCFSQGGQVITIPVSVTNFPIQKALQKMNFRAVRFEYTFHKWFA